MQVEVEMWISASMVDTGEIKYAIQFDGWQIIKDIEKHPDSDAQLNGVFIENWNTIKEEVIKFQ